MTGWKKLLNPLRSRKVRVALATVVAAYLAEYGLGVSEEIILTIIGVGVATILGIAHEDAGEKSRTRVEVAKLQPMTTLHSAGKNSDN